MTLGSLFDGIGGALLAAKMCGIVPIWASEIEPFPIKVTEYHFPDVKHLGDITQINGAEIEPVDIIVGGSPCQDLSVAGERAGLAGARSGLFMEQIRIVKEMRSETNKPRYMVWENVPGAFSSNNGEDFRAVLEETARVADPTVSIPRSVNGWANAGSILADRFTISWRTFDAQYWGVPQRRRRIYLVADFGGQSAPEILFEQESMPGNIAQSGSEGQGIAEDAERRINSAKPIVYMRGFGGRTSQEGISPTLVAAAGMGGNNQPIVCYGIGGYNSEGMKSDNPHSGIYKAETARTIDQNGGNPACNQGGIAVCSTYSFQRSDELEASDVASTQSARQYKSATDLVVASVDCRNLCETPKHGTLQAKENGGQSLNYSGAVRINKHVRRLTPKECERLQGFPDDYTNIPGSSDSARYKALGNSFAIPNIHFVIKRIKEVNHDG